MKILVIFGSHRIGGKNAEIEQAMRQYENTFDFDFVHLANHKVEGCTSCYECANTGHCVLPPSDNDKFQEILDKMVLADAIFVISPVYASIPSRLTALFERLVSLFFATGVMNTDKNPLLNKKAAIFSYCSCGICDEAPLKLLFDRYVMKNYRFDYSTYEYLNQVANPKEKYNDITDYVMDTLRLLV